MTDRDDGRHRRRPAPSTHRGAKVTEVICPNCGHRIGTAIRSGDVRIYCRRCKFTVHVTIEVVDEESQE